MDGDGAFCERQISEVSNTTLYSKIVIPSCDARSRDTMISHKFTCSDPACADCSEDGTTQIAQFPSALNMNEYGEYCLTSVDNNTKITTLTRFTSSQDVFSDGFYDYWKTFRKYSCLSAPMQSKLFVLAVVPNDFDLYEVADIAEEIVEIALAEAEETIDVRRELQGGKGLPNSCVATKEGTSDSQCKTINKGNVSYECKSGEGYVCCDEDQGGKFLTGSIAGKCFRNDGNGDRTNQSEAKYEAIGVTPQYIKGDPSIGAFTAFPIPANCESFPESFQAEPGDKCVNVTMTLYGNNMDELEVYTSEINDAIESGIVETVLMNEYGVVEAKFKVDPKQTFPTPPPTIIPTTTNKTVVDEIMDDVNNEIHNIFKDRPIGTTTEGASGNTTTAQASPNATNDQTEVESSARSASSSLVFMVSMAVSVVLFVFW